MIVFNLCCDNEHVFEGWFANAEAFSDQAAHGLIACPVCNSTRIERRPSAPYVHTANMRDKSAPQKTTTDPEVFAAAFRMAARQAEDVGEQFPSEARRIHHGEAEQRAIRGQASNEDLGELLEEGIFVLPIPDEPSIQ